jgi:hypothetical protein
MQIHFKHNHFFVSFINYPATIKAQITYNNLRGQFRIEKLII